MSPLQTRKQLLLAESELNRAHMVDDIHVMIEGVHNVADKAKSVGTLASYAGMFMAGMTAFKRQRSANGAEKPSWFQTMFKGAGLVSSLWSAFRSERK